MSLVAGVSLASLAPGSPVSVSILSTGDSSYSLALEERIDGTTSIDKALRNAFERLSAKVPNKLDHVIFTLPIYFTESEKEVVYSAAKFAGWLVPRNLEGILNHIQSYHRSTVEKNYAPQYELVLDIGPSAAGSRLVSTEVEENVRVTSDEVVDHVVPQHVDVQEIVRKIVDPAVAKLPSVTALKRVVVIGSSTDAVAPLVEELRSKFSSNDSVRIVVPSEQPSQHAAKLALALRQFALSDKLCVFNTAPLRIGIAKSDGFVLTLLPKNFTLPNKRSALLTTSQNNQTRAAIRIVAGVSPRVGENTVVAELTLEGLAPRPAGTSNVKVTIDADETGATRIITEEIDNDGQSTQQKTVELKALTGDMTEDQLEVYWKQGDSVVDEEAVEADAAWAGKTVQGALPA